VPAASAGLSALPPPHPAPFLLGDWLVEPALDRLSRNGTLVHVRPQAMDLLVFLASHPGEVVSHDETMAAVWRERFVNEYALTRCIADLRKALGEDARHTQYIENIPKRGYRVIAPVIRVADSSQEAAAPGHPPGHSIADATADALPAADRATPAAALGAVSHEDSLVDGRARGPAPATPPATPEERRVAETDVPARHELHRATLALAGLGLFTLGAGLAGLAPRLLPARPPDVSVLQLSLTPADGVRRTVRGTPGGSRTALAFTPDGRTLAFLGCAGDSTAIYLRRLDRDIADRLAGTDGAEVLAASPDGRALAFWANGQIRTVPISGGPVTRVCVTGNPQVPPFGLSWGDDGHIVYALEASGLWRVAVGGGRPAPVTTLRPGEASHGLPHVLPGSRAVLFTVRHSTLAWSREEIALQRLDRDERVRLLDHGADARYVPTGHLLFADFGSLAAVPFELETLAVTGPPVPLVEHVAQALNEASASEDSGSGQFAASATGDLAYLRREGGIAPSARLVLAWMDLRGHLSPLPVEPRHYVQPRLSPDGTRIATIVRNLESVDLWLYDLRRGAWTPLTEDADAQGFAWSPDGTELVVADPARTFVQAARAGAPARDVVRSDGARLLPSSWSRVGQVAFLTGLDSARLDIETITLRDPARRVMPFATHKAHEAFAEFSPDGRWIAYASGESGQDEVYVRPSADEGDRVQVSTGGGSNPIWRRDGREILFAARRGGGPGILLQAAPIDARPGGLAVGPTRTVLTLPDVELGLAVNGWDVASDGRRFLVAVHVRGDADPPVTHAEFVKHFGTRLPSAR